MHARSNRILVLCFLLVGSFPRWARPQIFNASVTGVVSYPIGGLVPNARLTLRALKTEPVSKTASDSAGLYSFPNLSAGTYELSAQAPGFRDFVQTKERYGQQLSSPS
jgi:hypothetical protein